MVKRKFYKNSPGNYGTPGNPSTTNSPGARADFISWEYNGEFYIFGGNGYDRNGKIGLLNDVWKFNPTNNTWTWVSGSGEFNEPANYGIINTPAASNTPGSRASTMGWNVANKTYLFGGVIAQSKVEGSSVDNYSDLWEYDLTTNVWTWIKGNTSQNTLSFHLGQGVVSPLNDPGSRGTAIPGVLNGQLYLFGGFEVYMGTGGFNNDLWKFDPSVNMWTWVKGDDGIEINGIYGPLGVENVANNPGSRASTKMWTSNNKLYLFGGIGQGETQAGELSDIWNYNPVTNNWTWIGGSKLVDLQSNYGTQGQLSANNTPGGRSTTYIANNLLDVYVFGGFGTNETPQFGGGSLNDLWRLNISQQQGACSIIVNFNAKKINDTEVGHNMECC